MRVASVAPFAARLRWAVALAVLAAAALSPAAAVERVALVIGNASYAGVGRLQNPVNDATAVAASLTRIGFDVTHLSDLGAAGMRRALQDFEDAARGAVIALVYYAGHGIEVDGENYLVPVDAKLLRDTHVEDETVPLSRVLRAIEGASQLKLVMLDACRNNPFAAQMERSSAARSIGRGLARVEPAAKTLVAYAAKGGTTAEDGDGEHSPFAVALLNHIETPGLEINFLFRIVHDEVFEATGRAQEPFVYGSLGATPIYLVPGETPPTAPASPGAAPEAPASSPDAAEADYLAALRTNTEQAYRDFLRTHPTSPRVAQVNSLIGALVENEIWESVADEDTVAAYQRYLAAFPGGVYSDAAGDRMRQLVRERQQVASREPTPSAPQSDSCGHPHGNYRVTGIAANDVLWVRERPDRDSAQRGSIPPGAGGIGVGRCVAVEGYRSPWCEVRYSCVSGWSYARYLEEAGGTATEETYRVYGVAADDVLNMRSGPSTGYPIVAAIPPNGRGVAISSCRRIAGYSNKWCLVAWQGVSGWASACCLAGESSGRRPD